MAFVPPEWFGEVPEHTEFFQDGSKRPHCCIDWLMYLDTHKCPWDHIRVMDDYFKHTDTHREKPVKVGNGVYNGAYAFTLTKSPDDPQSVGDMLKAVKTLMAQKTAPVAKYAWYLESKGTDVDGTLLHPHIHGMYETETGGRIPRRQFMRAWKLWDPAEGDKRKGGIPMGNGFRGGYHKPVESDKGYSDYIKKDGGISESSGQN
jgi:hypothetical protein